MIAFRFKLAFATGWTLEYIDNLSEDDYVGCYAYDQIFGIDQPWLRHGSLLAHLAQMMGDKSAKPTDYMPTDRPEDRPKSPALIQALADADRIEFEMRQRQIAAMNPK